MVAGVAGEGGGPGGPADGVGGSETIRPCGVDGGVRYQGV